jgi:hypothetical protein
MRFSRLFAAILNSIYGAGIVPRGFGGGLRHVAMEQTPGAGGGGQGGAPGAGGQGGAPGAGGQGGQAPQIPAELQSVVQSMIDNAVQGLKNKNGELHGKLKDATTALQQFDGIDPEAVKTILKRFGDDEEASLIKAGKIDEVLNRRTERLAADWQKKVDAEKQRAQKLEAKANKLAARATSEAIIKAATKAGALPEAAEDIVLRAQGAGFTINDEGDVVAMRDGEIVFSKDGKTPLSPVEWAEGLREAAPHLWPRAQGSGAPGSGNGGFQGNVDLSKLTPEQKLTHARANPQAARH